MEHRDTTEDRLFREEAREWLNANRPQGRRPGDEDLAGQMAYDRAWQRAQYDGGWAGVHWPKAYGGRGATPAEQLIWCEEYAAAKCPLVHDSIWMALNHAGPTLIARGAPEQKAFHLPRILKGEAAWCQGFSEPNSGSDLASLRTRGDVDGDHLVVNGQKTWTTYAHLSDYQELLVRTGPADGRHRGLTWAICDMKAEGLDVRPIKALDGHYHNCDCFYDNVRIPLANVVGEVMDGWSVVMTTFGFERGPAAFSSFCQVLVHLEEMMDYARTHPLPGGDRPAIEDPVFAQQLGLARARGQSLRSLMMMMIAAADQDLELGAEGSLMHLPYTEWEQTIYRLAVELMGGAGLSRRLPHDWALLYFKSFSATIAGGASEIQRNIIGERLLGLPR
jgi:alkylation response protein AidB-like acyl-CoA dehydrogenase